ncbi:nitrogenase iron-molybdenum cofactor biosynthesis protein NifN [Sideroxydans sp. CL21]|uniref:nitrogenase iron-molybdenum cofactor biosynthesis protein NifN n=1 Tax=Sideroxydans sp. CL21 TaxID=2600596 RepID=UPI0024BC5FF0|nr:nitrogenase iron-molybdenum cofactor biosynthesis protein NifN [Sideroxydans sp. CL21]
MAEILKRNKALAVNPLKASQPVGASLAFLGINKAIPMMHGSQGCTAFGKVYFVRHFREPVPLQTTAMDQVSTVMNADENVLLGLKAVCEKSKPALIGLPTTGLSETQGTDIKRLVKDFYAANPEFAHIPIVPVNTPDFTGCMESGYALAVKATLEVLIQSVPPPQPSPGGRGSLVGKRKKQVNVLAGSFLTPGDIEHIKELIEAFGLRPLVLPDIGDSLDGHLTEMESSPLTVGGTPVSDISSMGESIATLVLGNSLFEAADFLKEQTGVPDYRFNSLMGLDAVDGFVAALAGISGKPVPEKIERQRTQLQDAMVDSHFMLGFSRVAIAGDPDLLYGFAKLVTEMGCEVVAAVAPARANILQEVAAAQVAIGDLEDMENAAKKSGAQLIIGNSHAAESARRLGIPLLRAGFPLYDLIGGYQRLWVGYRGTRQALFDLANMVVEHGHHETEPYVSIYSQRTGNATHFPHPCVDVAALAALQPRPTPCGCNPPPVGEGTNAKDNFGEVCRATPATGHTY